jgi:phosphatidylethanolamine-binding protein (PEBP) family uncharacterized protein
MRRPPTLIAAALLSVFALAGCGSAESAATKVAKIPFTSTVLARNSIPALYTCDGKNISPSLEWGAVPADAGELVLFILGFRPEQNSTRFAVSVEWAVAGINPALHRLGPGTLPHGAKVGLSESGKRHYSLCPAKGTTEQYQFELYALPASMAVPPRFVGAEVLGTLNVNRPGTPTIAHGAFVALYKRK